MKAPPDLVGKLMKCPACKGALRQTADGLTCEDPGCAAQYPLAGAIPVLIDNKASVFSIGDFLSGKDTFFKPPTAVSRAVRSILPDISRNVVSKDNYAQYFAALRQRNPHPTVLVLGGSIAGKGLEDFLDDADVQFVETDVSFGPRTSIICDAHSLPFGPGAFDGVIVQAVLEHVIDPWKCVEEIRRVLRDDGLVYAETPFMQQLHAEPYDFTRFTVVGHRWLFRDFQEIGSGACGGPGMALAWSVEYFLVAFFASRFLKRVMKTLVRLTLFWLPYLDYYLVKKPGALAAASGFYFMGVKCAVPIGRAELLDRFRPAD